MLFLVKTTPLSLRYHQEPKYPNRQKKPLNFSPEFNQGPFSVTSDDIKVYGQVSQSHIQLFVWLKSLFINGSIDYDKNYMSDGESILSRKNKPLPVDKQCKKLIRYIWNGVKTEESKSKLANRIGVDSSNNIVNAIKGIRQFKEYFNENYERTPEEQEFIEIMREHKISYENLSRESVLTIVTSPIMNLIKERTIDIQDLINLDEEIIEYICENDEIIYALEGHEVDFDDLIDCLSDDLSEFSDAQNNLHDVKEIVDLFQRDPLHLKFMAGDPSDLVLENPDDETIVEFAIVNGYIDEDDISDIKASLKGNDGEETDESIAFEEICLESLEYVKY